MIDSILTSVKKALGIEKDYDVFDEEITMHINTVFSTLHSIGASPPEPFMILGETEKWSEFLLDVKKAMMVKTYMCLKVRLLFDPPTSSFALDSFKKNADELEWRLSIMEFDFNPESQPISGELQNKGLILLNQKIAEVDKQIDTLDEEVDSIPDLTVIFDNYLED